VSEPSPVVAEPENRKDALELAERLDPAIGETTSMVGAMLTELLRRTLRGGVLRIGDEMHGYVSEKLDTAIAERTPALERIAAEVAEHAARTAATEVATEEVHALEQRTRAGDAELADKISETARAAEQLTKESAEALAVQIKASDAELAAQIKASDAELTGKISETARAAEQWTKESAGALTTQIKEIEQRGQAALDEQVKALIDRSRERSDRLKARFVEQNSRIAGLSKQLGSVSKDLVRMLQENNAELKEALHKLEHEKESLAARVAELEKPRGLRALWQRLFGRRGAKPTDPSAAP
jgi:hypothetical protein